MLLVEAEAHHCPVEACCRGLSALVEGREADSPHGSSAQVAVMPDASRQGGSRQGGSGNLIHGMPSQHEKVSCEEGFAWVSRLFPGGETAFRGALVAVPW